MLVEALIRLGTTRDVYVDGQWEERSCKIAMIKAFRQCFGLGLREAKETAEACMETGGAVVTMTTSQFGHLIAYMSTREGGDLPFRYDVEALLEPNPRAINVAD